MTTCAAIHSKSARPRSHQRWPRLDPAFRFNEHRECDDGEIVFRHACKMGLEGIVGKRKASPIARRILSRAKTRTLRK